MPKTPASIAHFDVAGLLAAVHAQDIGLRITTNNPEGFKRLCYAAGRDNPSMAIHIYSDPRTPTAFFLLKTQIELEPAYVES